MLQHWAPLDVCTARVGPFSPKGKHTAETWRSALYPAPLPPGAWLHAMPCDPCARSSLDSPSTLHQTAHAHLYCAHLLGKASEARSCSGSSVDAPGDARARLGLCPHACRLYRTSDLKQRWLSGQLPAHVHALWAAHEGAVNCLAVVPTGASLRMPPPPSMHACMHPAMACNAVRYVCGFWPFGEGCNLWPGLHAVAPYGMADPHATAAGRLSAAGGAEQLLLSGGEDGRVRAWRLDSALQACALAPAAAAASSASSAATALTTAFPLALLPPAAQDGEDATGSGSGSGQQQGAGPSAAAAPPALQPVMDLKLPRGESSLGAMAAGGAAPSVLCMQYDGGSTLYVGECYTCQWAPACHHRHCSMRGGGSIEEKQVQIIERCQKWHALFAAAGQRLPMGSHNTAGPT